MIVLIRERTQISRQLIEKLPQAQADLADRPGRLAHRHQGLQRARRGGGRGQWLAEAPAELTWALIMAAMRRLPQYISNLKHGAWQQSGLKSASMPANFGLGLVLRGKTLGIWGYGRIGQLVAGYGQAFGMQVLVWGSDASCAKAASDGFQVAGSREELFADDRRAVSLHLRLTEETRGIVHAGGPGAA